MLRTALFSFLLFLPLASHGFHLHEIVRRDAKDHHSWSYEGLSGPEHWSTAFKKCGGSRQSPINIVTNEALYNENLDEFEFDNYEDSLQEAKIENNGHTIQISPGHNEVARFIDGGGLDSRYRFLQVHFHWGSDSKKGSEHTVDGQRFPLEMHLVHINTKYKTKEEAVHERDGIAVLGILFKVSEEDNPALVPIIDKLNEVRKKGAKAKLDDFNLESLLPEERMPYYRYEGSLTTPPCYEIVTWTVFRHHVPISEKQLQQFRNIKEGDGNEEDENLVDNFRPVQELHGRTVQISGDESSTGAIEIPSMMMVLSAISFFL
ncbi:Carbonic anhydrase 7, partial [Stegodyphus mimosarum]